MWSVEIMMIVPKAPSASAAYAGLWKAAAVIMTAKQVNSVTGTITSACLGRTASMMRIVARESAVIRVPVCLRSVWTMGIVAGS